ncbi:glycosyl transferase family A [Mergibacter septicus]|uniref:glycosyltransferase family 2 protein n=1 Tax=Mergibacter septicus TaxID=221402 RepID=UPI00117934D8|nr:glycosyltransferase family A protein [Mergibacter septicus]AWX13666.1 glycosyl transferase family A [Mergibacter septicus]
MDLFKKANKFFLSKEYNKALDLYILIGRLYGINELVEYQISKCREKINGENIVNNSEINSLLIPELYSLVEKTPIDSYQDKLNDSFSYPLITVIITAYNTQEFIESSINSVLLQSYKNIEIIVIDDYSNDNTYEIATRIASSNSKVKVFRLNSNLGTYYAKNLGIKKSKGEIIFFQDSDDVCHFERIERCVNSLLKNPNCVAVRSGYSRIDLNTHTVITVNDSIYRIGLITLGVYRKVFDDIGFFNCTTKASDDEFLNRIIAYYGREKISIVDLPLYYNTMRDNSLFSDMVKWKDKSSIIQTVSNSRCNYVKEFTVLHKEIDKSKYKEIFYYPRCKDAINVEDDMSKLPNPKLPIYISICSIPSRIKSLEKVIQALNHQCDFFYIYLDGYENIPKFIEKLHHKAKVVICNDKNTSLRDNGKFLLLEELIKENKDGYYFTCDDDIEYPVDYVNTLLERLYKYQEKVVVGSHGVILSNRIKKYFSDDRIVYHFRKSLEKDIPVNILGTGTVAFRVGIFSRFCLSEFKFPGMADIYFAIECKKNNILQICIERHNNWLKEYSSISETLYKEFVINDSKQTKLIKDNYPWGYTSILPLLSEVNEFKSLIPKLFFYNR